eukprot:snap_masked-scaffold_17-processed-gene-4.13-mRNA-1 protein AED:1.00 eAED:1.00 QI:0/-1/0/0/-1/1/1/0/318
METKNHLKDVLENETVEGVIQNQKMIYIDGRSSNILRSATTLVEAGVSSLPIFATSSSSGTLDFTSCHGILEFETILQYFLSLLKEGYDSKSTTRNIWDKLSSTIVTDLFHEENTNQFKLLLSEPLSAALQKFSVGNKRLLIVDDSDEVCGVLSASATVKHIVDLLKDREEADELLDKTIGDIFEALDAKEAFVINDRHKLSYVFDSMVGMNLQAALVVRHQTALVCITMSDVKRLFDDRDLGHLRKTALTFAREIKDQETDALVPVVSVLRSTKLLHAISHLLVRGVHQIFLMESNPDLPVRIIDYECIAKVIMTSL